MKQTRPDGLLRAAIALLAVSFSTTLLAQMQPSRQPENLGLASEAVVLLLPEAPLAQALAQSSPTSPAPAPTSSKPTAAGSPTPGCSSSQPPSHAATEATPGSTQSAPAVGCAPPTAASPSDAKQQTHAEAERELKAEEKQRLLGVMPQFQVVMGGTAAPLTGGEKWRLALHSAIDPFYIGWAFVIGGGYGELVGNNNGYGWGADGYIKRVGANYADNVNGALIGNALLPQLLHQDPRYFRKGTGSIKSRFLYAALSTVVCRGDNGKKQANVSNVLGNYVSGAISNSYYPANERGVALTLENGTSVTLFGALGGQLLEFGPDLARLVRKRHPPVTGTPPVAGPAPAATPASSPQNTTQ